MKRWLIIFLTLAMAIAMVGCGVRRPSQANANLTPTPAEPIATPTTVPTAATEFLPGWNTNWYRSPFRDVTDQLEDPATWETFAEPGVLLDDTAAWDYLSAETTPINVPEGGYTYVAVGHMKVEYEDIILELPWRQENIYLVIFRGIPDDGTDVDLNSQVWLGDYPRGFGIYSPMPSGAYVSLGWFEQQVTNVSNSPNCGADGCEHATVVVVDLATKTYRMWRVDPNAPRDWHRITD